MKTIKFKTYFPTVWGDLAYQNQILRSFAFIALLLTLMSLTITTFLVHRKPIVIALDTQSNVIPQAAPTKIEDDAERAARRYVEFRYVWQPENQALNLNNAKSFVASQSMKAFEKTAKELVLFSKGKNVAQRIYPTSVVVDPKENRIRIIADRFTEIQGLKAATYLKVNLVYQIGPSTATNPWGIYVVKEEEIQ